jgi:cytochrome c peroxidase
MTRAFQATQSCASCHAQASAFADNRALSRGATGEDHPRNAQPLAKWPSAPR